MKSENDLLDEFSIKDQQMIQDTNNNGALGNILNSLNADPFSKEYKIA